MTDLHDRFRNLDRIAAPDLWWEATQRSAAPAAGALGGRDWLGNRSSMLVPVALASVVLMAAFVGFGLFNGSGIGNLGGDPPSPFQGTWVSTSDTDGGTQTMTVSVSADDAVEITVTDDVATVCGATPSTMTGTGRIEGGTLLVIPAPVYTCDDGSEPATLSGPPLEEQLRNWTLVLDPETDTLSDGVGGVWLREGVEPSSPDPVAISDTMWPQSTLDEVRAAQERADAGDPGYTWQVDAQLAGDIQGEDYAVWERLSNGEVEIVDRFLREVLGWEAYIQNVWVGGADHSLDDQRFLRCAPGRTNPLYPPQPDSEQPGESCAPTLDDLTYESVSLDLVQPDRQGPRGIWVVSPWSPTTFAQADPTVAEAQATDRLEEFLAARLAGRGAEGQVDVYTGWLPRAVPLLYATTSGAPYERFEFERVDGPKWPYGGSITFMVRLFADNGSTVVEQQIESHWDGGRSVGVEGGLALSWTWTTENGEPVRMTFETFDGEVTYLLPSPTGWSFENASVDFTDPAVSWLECEQGPVPADAAGFAQAVAADPRFETTAPVAARVGGVEGVSMDVALAPGDRFCLAAGFGNDTYFSHKEVELRLRLYLVDVPEGMSMQTLLITVMAFQDFEEVVEQATPIIDSIEFHPG